MIARRTRPEEADRVADLFAIAFQLPREQAPVKETEGIQHWAAFREDGAMMSALTLTDFSVHFDGRRARMAGVGAVSTLPQYRGQGGIRSCFETCLPELYRKGYDFSYLYPFSTDFYRKFGYESCVSTLEVTVDLNRLRPGAFLGSFRLAEPENNFLWEIRMLDIEWNTRFNMAVLSRESDYGWAEHPDPAGTLTSTYVCFSPSGEPEAYACFRTENQSDGRNLVCSRFHFLNANGFNGLLRLFQTMAYDHRYLKFSLPCGQGYEFWLSEWASGALQLSLQPRGMVRIIDADRVLKKALCRGSGALILELRDPQIPENCGCRKITFADGAVCSTEPTDLSADIRMDISAFSTLMAGAGNVRWMPGVEILRNREAIDQVFYRKPLMIEEYF